MNGPSFFQTRMGQTFFEGTVPRLYRAIDRLADALGGKREYKLLSMNPNIENELNRYAEEGWRAVHFEGTRIFLERVVSRGGARR